MISAKASTRKTPLWWRLPRQLATPSALRMTPRETEECSISNCGIRGVGASVIGPTHKASGGVRQDSFVMRQTANFVIAIAADGLGSAAFSHAASFFACRVGAKCIAHGIQAQNGRCTELDAVRIVRQALWQIACALDNAEKRGAPGPMYTTLLGAVCSPEFTLTFNFGDGAVIAFDTGGGGYVRRSFLGPEHGGYSGEVYPLLPEGFDEHLRVDVTSHAQRIFIATDGVADFALRDDETDMKPEFALKFNEAIGALSSEQACRELVNYLQGGRASSVNADDKTLLWLEL